MIDEFEKNSDTQTLFSKDDLSAHPPPVKYSLQSLP